MEAAILVIFGPIHRGMVLGELPGLPVTWQAHRGVVADGPALL